MINNDKSDINHFEHWKNGRATKYSQEFVKNQEDKQIINIISKELRNRKYSKLQITQGK